MDREKNGPADLTKHGDGSFFNGGSEPSAIPLEQDRISNSDRCFSVHFCDHIEKIAEVIARAAELPCVLGTAHLPKGYTPVTVEK